MRTRSTGRADTPISSSALVNVGFVRSRMYEIAQAYKIANVDDEVLELMELALHERLLTVTEQLVAISHKRMDEKSDVFECFSTSEPAATLQDSQRKENEEQLSENPIADPNLMSDNTNISLPKYRRVGSTNHDESLADNSCPPNQRRRITYSDALVFLERDERPPNPVFSYRCMANPQNETVIELG